ncbi:VOC family protein [Candidatus Bathyarchaeota archaeon]|nr:VOC family protein [Candidatus Bathyarchaeota archaeon]
MNVEKTKIRIGEISQIGVVVKDLKKSIENCWKTFGIGPWRIYTFEPPDFTDSMVRGKPVPYTMRLAMTEIGQMQYEFIEPLEGPSVYKEFLASKGEGIHHIMSRFEDVASEVAAFKKMGIDVLMSGKYRGGEFYYMDTEPILGTVYEIVKKRSIQSLPHDVYPPQ